MSAIALDTNVLVRLLVRDDAAQFAAAERVLAQAQDNGEPLLILLGALMETEWVLRSRYRLDKASIAQAFTQLLEVQGVVFEDEATAEEALYLWTNHPGADFADCLLNSRAAQMGRQRFLTFDRASARLPRAELLAPDLTPPSAGA